MNLARILILFAFTAFIACKNNPTDSPDLTPEDSAKYIGSNFTDNIRSTEFRTPEEERLGFKLPPGFEIQLYASEPDIGKPMNIAFDAKGRMWVTQSFEYPFPAVANSGRDHLTILEDTDKDGRADRFTQFNDSLNIPIGVLPINDGAVAYSIPYVYRFADANGDGKSDGGKKLLGPFKTMDTHGMINNFVRGYDGWIHACHGYTNRDTIAGTDGDSISMISGNTFRFKPDGSRVEHTTDGRINPFGLVYDELGYLYSTDCHTSPLYQLILGGDYLQWGKEEGMGYAPDMKSLSDEATALAGISYYADVQFPKEYQQNFFVGDVVRCRVYRYSAESKGSTPIGKREPDFLLSEDPWFRPVDVKLGPDGALYIADFYNSIIGHYEVPLDHPKRDHTSGRIWRITYKGKQNKGTDWSAADLTQLLHALDLDNMPVRMMAADQLSDRIGQPAIEPVTSLLQKKGISSRQYIHALWILQRLNALSNDLIKSAAANSDPVIRLHAMRILAERNPDSSKFYPLIMDAVSKDKDAHVRRAAIELLAKYPHINTVQTALALRRKVPDEDNHMVYTTRLCLRNLLRNNDLMKQVASMSWKEQDATNIADVLTGVPSADAGSFLSTYINNYLPAGKKAASFYQHIARYAPEENINNIVDIARRNSAKDSDSARLTWYKGIQQGLAQRGKIDLPELAAWGNEIAKGILIKYPATTAPTASILPLQSFAADIAGKHAMQSLIPELKAILLSRSVEKNSDLYSAALSLKTTALISLIKLDRQNATVLAQQFLSDSMDVRFRNAVGKLLGEFPAAVADKILGQIKNIPPDLQTNIAMALAGNPEGRDIIFKHIKSGLLFARTLLQPNVQERILLNISSKQQKEFTAITANLDPIDKDRQATIEVHLMDYEASRQHQTLSLDSGRLTFMQNCATCHSIGGQGGNIGPNLDGVDQWGPKALAEKILDPNRNVSENFRNYTIRQKDGKIVSGVYRRDEGALIVFADISGKEFSVPKKDIAEQTASRFTLMPDNFSSKLSQHEFNLLINFLVSQKK